MFQKILQYLKGNFTLTESEKTGLLKFFNSMENTTPKLKNKMEQIGNKYNFETIEKLKTPSPYEQTNTLFFWRESFEFPMSIALDEEDIDNEFMLFINENDIYSPFNELETREMSKICFDIYHSWVGFNFQKAKLYKNGIPMGITVNSDIVSYYFQDFLYQNFSNYHQLYNTNKKVTRPFVRDLTIEEIFIRTHLIQFPYKKIELVSSNFEYKEKMKLENSKMQIIKSELNSEVIISNTERQFGEGNRYERIENTCIDEIIKYFELTINNGFEFNLIDCELK